VFAKVPVASEGTLSHYKVQDEQMLFGIAFALAADLAWEVSGLH